MKKPGYKYDVTFETVSKTKLGGKKCTQTIVETVTGLNTKGIEEVLKERLDLAVRPGGKPYRPTVEDLEKSMGHLISNDNKWIKKQVKVYQQAYDLYDKIMSLLDSGPEVIYRNFKPFELYIDIKIY